MAEPSSCADDPDDPSTNPNFATALQSVPIPTMYLDDDFSFDFTLPEGLMADLEFDSDEDFDFSLDDLLPPSQNQPDHRFEEGSVALHSDALDPSGSGVSSSRVLDSPSPDSASSRVLDRDLSGSGASHLTGDQTSVAPHSDSLDRSGVSSCPDSNIRPRVLDSLSPDSDSYRVLDPSLPDSGSSRVFDQDPSGSGASRFTGDQRSDVDMVLNLPLLDSERKDQSDSDSFDHREVSGSRTVSSRVSSDWKSDSVRVLNSPSPDSSCSTDRHPSVDAVATDQRIKLEEVGKEWSLKRKKETEDGNPNPNARSSKFRRSLVSAEDAFAFRSGNEEEDKKKARLMRNRESAQLSRQRKKHYVEELEDKVRSMHSKIAELNNKISFIMAENASLRQQVGGGGQCPPPPGIYLPPPIAHYPWVPRSSYALKQPQGSSQVPLIPIPRLKPQQPISAPKAKSRTKKVASVSFLGLLFFVMIFGGLIPVANLRFGGIEDSVNGRLGLGNTGFMGQPRGKVLTVTGGLNRSDQSTGKSFGIGGPELINCRGVTEMCETEVTRKKRDGFAVSGNASEPLVASLYVPRNDKLVKIDGNLIIHSVLASEKAVASSHVVSSEEERSKTGLAIPNNLALALAVSKPGVDAERDSCMHGSPNECQKALGSVSKDRYRENLKSSATDGPLQQWFREGLAGPILSSGMCTEVFQFEVSPASAKPGAIVPATSVANISPNNSSSTTKRRNRRILFHPPIPLSGSTLNTTEEHIRKSAENGHFRGNKSSSSMVVSVLVDPREAGDGDGDGMISPPKSLSRIFVVVLMDSVKYVTYSCVLPLKGSGPQLVTT